MWIENYDRHDGISKECMGHGGAEWKKEKKKKKKKKQCNQGWRPIFDIETHMIKI